MDGKRQRGLTPGKKRPKYVKKKGSLWQTEDVAVHTSLPPQVDGQLRCFCRLSITRIDWLSVKHPDAVQVRVRWWGETGNGAIFRPESDKKLPEDGSKYRTVARYPVRSGPRQFTAYLADMSSLQLELITGRENDHVIGKADIHQISQLSPSMPIRGVFTVFSAKDEKIAELHATVVLESLMASYDSTGSIPTTDLSMTTRGSTADLSFPQKIPQPSPRPMEAISANHVFDSPETQKTRSRDEDSILRMASKKPNDISQPLQPLTNDAQLSVTTTGHIVQTEANHRVGRNIEPSVSAGPVLNPSINTNVITNLLERGNRLREAMRTSSRGQPLLQDASLDRAAVLNQHTPHWSAQTLNNLYANAAYSGQDKTSADLELRAVDLVLGDAFPSNHFSFDNDLSLRSSFYSDLDIESDIGDPIHDADLLEQLFYRKEYGVSDISADDIMVTSAIQTNTGLDLDDPGNIRPPSRHSSVTNLADLGSPQKTNTEVPKSHNSKKKSKLSAKGDNRASPKCEKRKSKTSAKTATPDKASRNRSISSSKSDTPKKQRSRPRTGSTSSQRSRSGSMSDSKQKVESKTRSRSQSNSKTKSRSKKNRGRLGRGSGSEFSDDDGDIQFTPRSDVSKVSFDMGNSDSDYKRARKAKNTASIDGISLDRLTLLGRVKFARVTAYSLSLDDVLTSFNTKPLNKGRSPKAVSANKKQSIYFLEYQFPVVAALPERSSSGTMVTEVTRVASKNVKDNVVLFQHHSVFPVQFDGTALEQWWQSALIFRLFARSSPQDKVTTLGSCGIPLKDILMAENLVFTSELPIHSEKGPHGTAKGAPKPFIGALSILIELSSDSKDFTSFLAKTKLTESKGGYKMVPIVQPPPTPPGAAAIAGFIRKPPQSPMGLEAHKKLVHQSIEDSKVGHIGQPKPLSASVPGAPSSMNKQLSSSQPGAHNNDIEEECLALNVLLVVSHGRNISLSSGNQQTAGKIYHDNSGTVPVNVNTYLVCRMFWSRDAVTSPVCWGTAEPQYSFMQIAPVLLTQSLFERMRDNVMVVEVWSKATAGQQDKLIGLVKLSLHQFYMSFHDKEIAKMLLKSQYPVVAVDQYQPVIDLFSGQQSGDIHILLAMGSTKQIAALQSLQMLSGTVKPHRPPHHLDAANRAGSCGAGQGVSSSVEHMFEVSLNGVRGLRVFDTMIWGEADCFVQYQFPEQNKEQHDGQHHPESIGCSLSWNRGVTTLCVPDACFNDTKRHRISLPCDVPLQKVLLSACAMSGQSSGVIPFEVWCRHYHPNTRDQVVAKAILPLAKLCAMVTMQKTGQVSTQTFSLPLTLVENSESNQLSGVPKREGGVRTKAFQDSGLLDVTVSYRRSVIEQSDGEMAAVSGNTVCLSIGVLRACGLKTAAELQADRTSSMRYPAEVGVNAYIKVNLSFLHKQPGRITKTVARSFCPDFSHHLDFPCPLVFNTSSSAPSCTSSYDDSDPISLAEYLEGGNVVLEVWHQVPRIIPGVGQERVNFSDVDVSNHEGDLEDILLGEVTVPLAYLLTRKMGIIGWYPIHPQDHRADDNHGNLQRTEDSSIGGLELSVKFARQGDCDKVVNAARLIGWAPMNAMELVAEADEQENDVSTDYALFSVAIDQARFPLANALRAGQTRLDTTTRCYIRYKFYDKNAVLTPAHSLSDSGSELLESRIRHKRHWMINLTAPLKWYLREEPIEIQVWLTYNNASAGERHHPGTKDRLIGSAYVSMDAVLDPRRRHLGVSGQFPLFKPSAASLGGASVRVRLNLTTGSKEELNKQADCNLSDECVDDEVNDHDDDEEYDPEDSFHHLAVKKRSITKELEKAKIEEEGVSSFAVHVIIDQAMHLPDVLDRRSGGKCPPSTYVSFQTSDPATPSCVTDVVSVTKSPVWDFEVDTQLGTDLLQQGNKNLVFKVWHKVESVSKTAESGGDRVLGFTTVDLLPLTSGLSQLCSWYHIVDFGGQCQGQIKVGITPLELLTRYATPAIPGQTDWPQDNKVWSPPCFTSNYASAIATDLPHFEEHYVNVKRHHESLNQQVSHQEQTLHQHAQQIIASQLGQYTIREALHGQQQYLGAMSGQESSVLDHAGGANDEMLPSRSVLFTCLRKQLHDLDEITVKLKSRLAVTDSSEQHSTAQQEKEHYNNDIILMTEPHVDNVPGKSSMNSNINNNNITADQHQLVTSDVYVNDINRIASYSSDSSSVKHLPTQIFMASGIRQEQNTHHRPHVHRGHKKEHHNKRLSENGYQSDDEDDGILDDKRNDDDVNHQQFMSNTSKLTYAASDIVNNRNNNNNDNQLLSVQIEDTEHLRSEAVSQEFHGMVKNLEKDFDEILNLSQSFSESVEFSNRNAVGNLDFLTGSDEEMSGSDVDVVVPRALNSISGKDVDRAEHSTLPEPQEFYHIRAADDDADLRRPTGSLPQHIDGGHSDSGQRSFGDNDSDVEDVDAWLPDSGSEIDAFRLRVREWGTGKEEASQVNHEIADDDGGLANQNHTLSTAVHLVNRDTRVLQSNTEQEEDEYNSEHENRNEASDIIAFVKNSDTAVNLENTSDWSEPELPDNTVVKNFSSDDDNGESEHSHRTKRDNAKIPECNDDDNFNAHALQLGDCRETDLPERSKVSFNLNAHYQDNSNDSETHAQDPVYEFRHTNMLLKQDANNTAHIDDKIEDNSDKIKRTIDSVNANHIGVDIVADQTVSEKREIPRKLICDSSAPSLSSEQITKDLCVLGDDPQDSDDKKTHDSKAVCSVNSHVQQNIATNDEDKPNSKTKAKLQKFREPAYPKLKVPDFFWSRDQLEQSLKSLQTGSTEAGQSLTRSQAKAQTAKDLMDRLASADNHASLTTALKEKPLPTDEERQRIARIFKTKFS